MTSYYAISKLEKEAIAWVCPSESIPCTRVKGDEVIGSKREGTNSKERNGWGRRRERYGEKHVME